MVYIFQNRPVWCRNLKESVLFPVGARIAVSQSNFLTLPYPFFLLILRELPVCAMHMRGAITSRDGGYSCSSLRSYYISMNWLKPESSRGGSFQLTPTHYLSRYSRCLERTPSGPRLPKWPALHYDKSRSTDLSVFMEIIDWVSWKETFCWMFVGHSPCVHMISSQLTLYYLRVNECGDVLVFFILILEVPDSGIGSATGYGNWNLLCFFSSLSTEMLE